MIKLEVETTKAQRFLRAKAERAGDARPALKKVQKYVIARIKLQFHKLSRGGTFRGVRWADLQGRPGERKREGYSTRGGPFGGYRKGVYSDLATRKVRGGTRTTGRYTLGAMRPSGKRVTASSAVMHDTGKLLRSAGQFIRLLTPNQIVFGTNLLYAGPQEKRRPFMFFELPRDLDEAQRICLEHFKR